MAVAARCGIRVREDRILASFPSRGYRKRPVASASSAGGEESVRTEGSGEAEPGADPPLAEDAGSGEDAEAEGAGMDSDSGNLVRRT